MEKIIKKLIPTYMYIAISALFQAIFGVFKQIDCGILKQVKRDAKGIGYLKHKLEKYINRRK